MTDRVRIVHDPCGDADCRTVIFGCEACDEEHAIGVGNGPGPRWTFNENIERPTFSPSVRVTGIYRLSDEDYERIRAGEDLSKEKARVCHFFVRDGYIDYCADSNHHLAGQRRELPPIDGGAA